MHIKEFCSQLENVFDVEKNTLTGNEHLDDGSLMDSLTMLAVISFLDKEYNTQIDPSDILEINTINDLFEIVCNKEGLGNT